MENSKSIRYSTFSKNILGTSYPKLKILSKKIDKDGNIYYYVYFGKNNLSRWYTREEILKFGIKV